MCLSITFVSGSLAAGCRTLMRSGFGHLFCARFYSVNKTLGSWYPGYNFGINLEAYMDYGDLFNL